MRATIKKLRSVLLIAAVTVSFGDLRKTVYAFPDDCADICPSSDCNTQCYENAMEFENGNTISCRDYGVYDTSQMCCGDSACSAETGETLETCHADCYVPPPPEIQSTFLVNGSLNPVLPEWMYPNSPMYQEISQTYGRLPYVHFWSQNSASEVAPPSYSGIEAGGIQLASAVDALPLDEIVNLVAHSHGGNVLIRATQHINTRQVRHLIELATPVNEDLPRYLMGNGAAVRCTGSSWSDIVQFWGASPFQILGYIASMEEYELFGNYSFYYFTQQDYEAAAYWAGAAAFAWVAAQEFWDSTKIEWTGSTIPFDNFDHAMMHQAPAWWGLPAHCKVGS